MSRTSIKGFGLYIIGQLAVIALLLCLTAQNSFAQAPGVTTGGIIRPLDVTGTVTTDGLIIGDDAGWAGILWHFRPGPGEDRLYLTSSMGGRIKVVSGQLWFRDLIVQDHGGAIYFANTGTYRLVATGGNGMGVSGEARNFGFWNNTSAGSGGAIFNAETEIQLDRVYFGNNVALAGENFPGSARGGGAIFNRGGTMIFGDIPTPVGSSEGGNGGVHFGKMIVAPNMSALDPYTFTPYTHSPHATIPPGFVQPSNPNMALRVMHPTIILPPSIATTNIPPYIRYELDGTPYFVSTARWNLTADPRWATLARADGTGNTSHGRGGAIYNLNGNMRFLATASAGNGSHFANSATAGHHYPSPTGDGGATDYGNLFAGNLAHQHGGAFFNDGGEPTTFIATAGSITSDTRSIAITGGVAGNIRSARSHTIRTNTAWDARFIENTALWSGGAILNANFGAMQFIANSGAATANGIADHVSHAESRPGWVWAAAYADAHARVTSHSGYFTGNEARASLTNIEDSGFGGAIYIEGGALRFAATNGNANATTNSIGDSTSGEATAVDIAWAESTARTGHFTRNRASWDGGAIFVDYGGVLTFSSNPVFTSGALTDATPTGADDVVANARASASTPGNSTRSAVSDSTALSLANAGVFENNVAGDRGGAIFLDYGTTTFTVGGAHALADARAGTRADATAWATANAGDFIRNEALLGGAIYNRFGSLTFQALGDASATATSSGGTSRAVALARAFASTFTDNTATLDASKASGFGGAIYNEGGRLMFFAPGSVTITSTSSYTGTGGNVNNWNNLLGINTLNRDTAWLAYGGLANYAYAEADVAASIFQGNTAALRGGAIYNTPEGELTFIGTTRFVEYVPDLSTAVNPLASYTRWGNTAPDLGGAIYNDQGVLTFIASSNSTGTATQGYTTFRSNIAGTVDGPVTPDAQGRLTNITLTGLGGAIYNDGGTISFYNDSYIDSRGDYVGVITRNANLRGGMFGWNATSTPPSSVSDPGRVLGNLGNRAIDGGVIYNTEDGTIVLANVWIWFNLADDNPVITGSANIGDNGGRGGGIFNDGGLVEIHGSTFWDNIAVYGGAIYNRNLTQNDNFIFIDGRGFTGGVAFDRNVASGGRGGAIYNEKNAHITVWNTLFEGNRAAQGGGAIWNDGTMDIDGDAPYRTIFRNNNDFGNQAGLNPLGGAIYNARTGTLTLGNSSFDQNHLILAGGYGGAIYNDGGALTFTGGSAFNQNDAHSGGAIYNNGGWLVINGSSAATPERFINNEARRGGAIFNTNAGPGLIGRLDLTDVLFDRNRATETLAGYSGGAIYNDVGSIANLTRVDFNDNSAEVIGGAIYNLGTLNLTDVNFSQNVTVASQGRGSAIYNQGGAISLTVTAGTTSTYLNNTRGASGGPTGWQDGTNESIYFAGMGGLNITVGAGGRLEMYDPMRGEAGSVTNITKMGTGYWLLAGENDFTGIDGTGRANVTVDAGTLHLHRHDYGRVRPATPYVPDFKHASLLLGNGSFVLSSGATLMVDGAVRNPNGTLVDSGSVISADGGITIRTGSTMELYLSNADVERTRLPDPKATLTLESDGSIVVGSVVHVYLTGQTVSGEASDMWASWFLGGGADPGDREILVIDNGRGDGLRPNLMVGAIYHRSSDTDPWERWSNVLRRNVSGNVKALLIVDDGYLKMTDDEIAVRLFIDWTGAVDHVWTSATSTITANWSAYESLLGGIVLADTFVEGDYVRFADFYTYYDEATGEDATGTPMNRNIAIDSNVRVGSMNVTGSGYVFNIADGVTLRAARNIASLHRGPEPNINFGTANVNMGANSRINAEGRVSFGADSTIGVDGLNTRIIAGNGIEFTGNTNIFRFDMTDANATTAALLTLQGNVINTTATGAVGGGEIQLNNFDQNSIDPGQNISLISIVGNGSVTNTGRLMINGMENIPRRNDISGIMLGLGIHNGGKDLVLLLVDATGNTELHWTGRTNSVWDDHTEDRDGTSNWSGDLNGVNVTTFVTGDRVFFGNDDVFNKTVRATYGGITAGDLTVLTGATGYEFDVRQGSITADASASSLASATGNINFGSGSTIRSGLNSSITTLGRTGTGTITFGTDTVFSFDLTSADADDTLLTLQGNVTAAEKIGSGNIHLSGVPTLSIGNTVVLVDAGANNTNVTASTGTLYLNGIEYSPKRSPSGDVIYGLVTGADDSQLLLKWVNSDAKSEDLAWTGKSPQRFGGTPYYIWESAGAYPNWQGMVEGIPVDTFLHGDTVRFGALTGTDVALRKKVIVDEGGVMIDSMFVTDTGYTFDLMGGGIAGRKGGGIIASGSVDLRDSRIVVGLNYDSIFNHVSFNRITANEISVNGTTVEVRTTWDASEDAVIAEAIRNNGGELDIDILISTDAPINDHGRGINLDMRTSSYFNRLFIIDNEPSLGRSTQSGRGILRLSYFYFETVGWNHNTRQAGKALDVLRHVRGDDPLFDWIGNNRRQAVDQLRGTELVADALAIPMWRPWEITHTRTRTVQEESGWNSWGSAYYRFGNTKTDDNAEKFDMFRSGMAVGADYGSNRYWQFGGMFGAGMPNIRNTFGKVDATDLTLGVYSKLNYFDQAWISAFLGYGYQSYEMTRHCFGDRYRSKFDGDAFYASVEFVKPIQVPVVTIMPLVAIDHQTSWIKGFSESGAWGQTLAGTSLDRTMVRVGVDTKWDTIEWGIANFNVMSRLQAAILVDGDKRASVVSYFPNSSASMKLYGADMGMAQVNAGVSAIGEYGPSFRWFVDLDGFSSGKTTSFQAGAGLSTRF